ncbi:MAG: SDR family oxidoreductase [Chloroflexi bacterium]|nr:SDR family oxidoreductase [Chloroflexota bacterium]MBP8057500.1 SDR family oxidoreductase [Chloroflexota bacterium]
MELRGKVAVITGGAVRLGRAITLALAEAGCNVLIHYGHSAAASQETRLLAQAQGVKAITYQADLCDAAATQTIIPTACHHFGRVDILINNAAVFPETDQFSTLNLDQWQEIMDINLRAPFLLSQALAHHLHEGQNGRIINLNDARVSRPAPDHFAYRLSKGALWNMTEILAHALAPRVTVNEVALGAILPPPGQADSYLNAIAQQRVPLRRAGNTHIVVENILHLLRQDFLTGVTLPIDGGEFL